MKFNSRIIGLICILLPLSSWASGKSIDQSESVSGDGTVEVNVVRGEVRFHGWDKDTVRVTGELDESLEEFVFEVDGDTTRIRVELEKDLSFWSTPDETDIDIYVPSNSRIDFSGVSTDMACTEVKGEISVGLVSGDVYVEGHDARINIQTVSGDVELSDATARVRTRTVSGDIESRNVVGDVLYTTVSGDIVIYEGGDDLRLESVSGDIEVRHDEVRTLGGHSVSGDIDIDGRMKPEGAIDFDSMSGSIRLKLSGDINASFDVETGSGGIRNRVTDDEPRASRSQRHEQLRFTVGKGSGRVSLSTHSGDITLLSR